MSSSGVSIIVPFRPEGDGRRRNWDFIRARYAALHPEWEVVEGTCEGRWSKGRAVNDAVSRASGDIFVIADADVIVGQRALSDAVDALRISSWVVPHRLVFRLNEEATAAIIAECRQEPWDLDHQDCTRVHKGCQGGGISILPREAFHAVGGIDEGFEDWGGEDISFSRALDSIVGVHRRMGERMWHLYHEPMERREGNRACEESEALAARYLDATTTGATRALLSQRAYEGMLGGGILVTSRETVADVPLDARFEGWGQEDESWGLALATLAGGPHRGDAALLHLHHEAAPRMSQTRGNLPGWDLRRRYVQALGDPVAMRTLIEEARAAFAVDPDPVHA